MEEGLDYVTGPPVASLKAAGITFVCRYLSEVNKLTETKLLTLDEAKTLGAAGIAIVSNYEWTGTTPLGGKKAGIYDAQIARDQHAACGGPANRPIYFSVDFNPTDAEMPAVIDYFKNGVASVIGLARTGAYGSYRAIKALFDAGAITWGWQTYAWSGIEWEPRAHLRQYENGVIMDKLEVDRDRATVSDFGQWNPVGGSPIVQTYSPSSADFGQFFTANDADHWTCKQTGRILQYGIKGFYSKLSMDGNSLPIVGLPLTNEIYIKVNGHDVVIIICERAGIGYDPAHVKDHQPGTGDCFLFHLTDQDFLKNIPGLSFGQTFPDAAGAITQAHAAYGALAEVIKDLGGTP